MGVDGTLRFIGTSRPERSRPGDVYHDLKTGLDYVFVEPERDWIPIEPFNKIESAHVVKIKRCTSCGANLPLNKVDENGLCECSYCSKIEYVWED